MGRKTSHGPFSCPARSLLAVDLPIDDPHGHIPRTCRDGCRGVTGICGGADRGWDGARAGADGGNIKPCLRAQASCTNFFSILTEKPNGVRGVAHLGTAAE